MWKKNSLAGRLVIGTVLTLLVTGTILFTGSGILTLLVAVWVSFATMEFIQLLRRAEIVLPAWFTLILNLTIVLAAWRNWLPGFLIAPIGMVFLFAIARRPALPRIPVYGTFTLIYLGFLPSHLILLRNLAQEKQLSPLLVLFPLVLTWVNDTAAFALGKILGRHKLAPALSPSKTREGFLAGLVFSALLSGIWLPRLKPFSSHPIWWLALVGIGLGAIAQAGDLFESIFKRAVAVKDSSAALGEHGGFLDRVDSLLFTIPAFYYLAWFLCR